MIITPALSSLLAEVRERVIGKRLFIGFDRDGTIVPYADRPENALMTESLRAALHRLAQRPNTKLCVVSARSIALLQPDFDCDRVTLAGNYGMEILTPPGNKTIEPIADAARPFLKQVRDHLSELSRPEINAIIEDHGYSLCLHWHSVPVEKRELVKDFMTEAQERFPELLFVSQPTSFEVLPRNQWNKGKALEQIYQLGQSDADTLCMFFGDSDADEFAFQWVNGRDGISVKVGAGKHNTVSKYQLPDTAEVQQFIEQLAFV